MDTFPRANTERALPNRHHTESDTIDLLKLWSVLWQAKWNIAALVLISSMLAVVAVLNLAPQYRASSSLLIEEKNPRVLSFQQVYDPANTTSEYLQTQLGLLQSRALAERVVGALQLSSNPLFDPRQQPESMFSVRRILNSLGLDEIISNLRSGDDGATGAITEEQAFNHATHTLMNLTHVQLVGKSQLLSISVETPDATLSANIANALATGFIESQLDASLDMSLSTTNWMNSRLEELREKLKSAENTLQAYREAEGLVDVDGVATISANELSMTGNRMIDARRQRAEAESQYRQVQTMRSGGLDRLSSVPAVLGHPLIQQFKADEARAQAKVEELSRRYGDKHPTMIAARSELAAATASLQAQVELVVAGIERNYQLAQANESSLRQSFNNNKEQIQDISRKEFKLRELQREVDSNRVLYETFLTRLKETAATSDINSSNARVVDMAIAPGKPSKPRKTLIVAIAAVLAAIFGIGLTLLFEALNNTFKSTDDVENKLNLPVLSIIPLVPKKNRNQVSHLFEQAQDKRFCESIRTLRTSLVLADLGSPRKIVLVTSSVPGEGKSSIANNLAFSIAHIERVLLIDADLRRPTMARNFDFPVGSPGLANLIAGTAKLEDCIRTVGDVDMIPAGMVPPNPQELLSSARLTKILELLKGRYQRIIIDSPPTQAVSDSMLLATISDALIYVVRAESTSIPLVQKGVGQLLQNNAPITGVVLNQVDLRKARKYGYSYYENYSYQLQPQS
ncbi:polysaccharide biosynthesis tyrosine autokinase [Pseudomonas sp. PDM14]|uniref:GumC family protein n=1 Tax=Pseudomonas sp. PDM14 TaxID=2769288 RepID=UPI00178414EE|nr:polysaccharide biosynthesis tyrosine autokinase [Pseudomonas sp. PDM14]MBD9482582.1 polysaccharide biosynthesis tyrosine autokinase [Pseudomonas sp. PDM14]